MAAVLAAGDMTVPPVINIVHGTHPQLIAYLVLNIWPSHFGIPVLLAIIFFSKKIQRHPTFVNLCITFIIAGISASLLAYVGKATGPEPSPVLCLLQASLLYGYPPMTSVAAFALVLQMFLVVRASYYGQELLERNHVVRLWGMLIGPYVAFFIGVLATAIIGAANPTKVSRGRRFFYCSVESAPLTNSITVFAAVFLFGTVYIEGWLLLILYKRWVALNANRLKSTTSLELSMPLRVIAYGFYSTLALSLSLLSIKAPESPVPDLMIASASSVLMVIFGTQKDIIHWWKDNSKILNQDTSGQPPEPPPKDYKVSMSHDLNHQPPKVIKWPRTPAM
ncbi:hypothetical protein Hypma_012473 [Hypsizygus marmoreus]|uniref:G-protein coupled receptors family 1 profile domain-containing protein n=1 Tax=Hypsizygus marmoreus TaxID=39966 RepID=A0A369JL41_HYPMA|nr:hypothetical protein Hypma_012473 [Hypsizygus marmoreus]